MEEDDSNIPKKSLTMSTSKIRQNFVASLLPCVLRPGVDINNHVCINPFEGLLSLNYPVAAKNALGSQSMRTPEATQKRVHL